MFISLTISLRCSAGEYFFYFNLYIYPPDSQESDGGANTQGGQLPRPASGDAKILLSAYNLIET